MTMAPSYWRDAVTGLGMSSKKRDDAAQLQHDAEALSERLPPLLVDAERIANTVAPGIHGRRRAGPGETFWQFRHHVAGDTASSIDWRQSAKSQSYFVRENEWEVAESVWLWCDQSASMDYSYTDENPTKQYRATVLAMALGHLLLRAGERVGVLGEGRAPLMGLSTFARLGSLLLATSTGSDGLPPNVQLPRHARVVLLSDFLTPAQTMFDRLDRLAKSGARGHLVHILDPAEEDFPFEGRTLFEGMEDNSKLVVGRAEALRSVYCERMTELQTELSLWARRMGWSYSRHRTDKPPHLTLLQFYDLLSGAYARVVDNGARL